MMVHKAEVRIGNLLKPRESLKECSVVKGITETSVHLADGHTYDFIDIEPIRLTAEILEKSGFIYGRKYCGEEFYDFKKAFDLNGNEVWEFKRNNKSLKYLRYMHQAQNLFYEISGEELEFTI